VELGRNTIFSFYQIAGRTSSSGLGGGTAGASEAPLERLEQLQLQLPTPGISMQRPGRLPGTIYVRPRSGDFVLQSR